MSRLSLVSSKEIPQEAGRAAVDVRMLEADDAAVLANVADDVFDAAVDASLVDEFLRDPRHHLAVAIDRQQVVGFASGVHYVHPDKRPQMFINEVGVAPSHQGRGIGKALVEKILERARRLGCEEAWVLTERDNHAAMRLYGSTGGEPSPKDAVMFTFFLDRDDRRPR